MVLKQLRLNTLQNSRKSYARILKAFNGGDLAEAKFRGLIYGMTGYLQYWKLEADLRIDDRLEEIEKLLEVKK